MHLLMLTSSCDPNLKEEGFISDWVIYLAKNVNKLTLLTLTKPTITLPSNVRSYVVSSNSKLGKLWEIWNIILLEHKNHKMDGLFCNMYDFLGVAIGLISRLLSVKSIYWYAGGITVPFLSLTSISFLLNSIIATCSDQEKQRYHTMFKTSLSKIKVIGHGINKQRFVNKKDQRDKKYFTIGYCCRLSKSKNIESLLDLANHDLKSNKPIKLLLALSKTFENKPYLEYLQSKIKEINKTGKIKIKILTFITYINNARFYKQLDLYVHPSLQTSIDKGRSGSSLFGDTCIVIKKRI